jgi:Rrf2 family protein
VNVSAKTEYACLAVLELATRFGSGEPVRVGHIAERYGIPARFLVQILAQLKGAGFVGSTRGVAGGYHLIRDPVALSLADVMSVVEGGWQDVTGSADRETIASRMLVAIWNEAARAERSVLANVTFARLVERLHADTPHMYFI